MLRGQSAQNELVILSSDEVCIKSAKADDDNDDADEYHEEEGEDDAHMLLTRKGIHYKADFA